MRAGDGYSRHANDSGETSPDWAPAESSLPSTLADASPPSRAGQTGPGRRRPARRTWWIAPFLGGAFAVVAVTAIVQLAVLPHLTGKPAPTKSASDSQAGPMPAQMFPDALFTKLTQDIQHRNEAGLLSLVAPGARPAVRIWWENGQAIGFTTGLIMPTAAIDRVDVNSHGNGTTTVLAGFHNPLDPVDQGKPEVPCERYTIGLHFATPTAIGQITSWKPLGDDPWDQGPLYVRKSANVVVAGPQADSGLVDETLPIAQAAATYDVGLINQVNSDDLHQLGFIVFVSGNSAVRNRWFTTGPQPAGWPTALFGGLTAVLPGPGASADTQFNAGDVSNAVAGGARVVITPFEDQSGQTPSGETLQLVDHFMLDILVADDNFPPGPGVPAPVPAWATQGFATAVAFLYAENTNPAPATYNFAALDSALKAMPASFRDGHLPTSQQLLTGQENSRDNWNYIAASVYEYIEHKAGMQQMLAAAGLLWTQDPTPFGNVLASRTGQTLNFYNAATIESGWKAMLAAD